MLSSYLFFWKKIISCSFKKIFIFILLGVGGIILIILSLRQKIDQPFLHVSFLDVGQGDAILIQTPSHGTVLIDGGPDDRVVDEVRKKLPYGQTHINLVVATHPDKDHIAGLVPLFTYYEIDHYLSNETTSPTSFSRNLEHRIEQEPHLQKHLARRGQCIVIDQKHHIVLEVLFPDQSTEYFKDTNETSVVLLLHYGHQKFLFTGDAPESVERYLSAYDTQHLQGSILKLGHHGSKTSSSEIFLQTIQPVLGIVSAGKNNTYHHPHEEILHRFEAYHIPVRSTLDEGTITLTSDGESFW
jgi:competence protein ComEC